MRLALLLGAAIAVSAVTSASSAVRIKGDAGGQIGPYVEKMAALRGSGEKVIIDASKTPGFSIARLRQAFDEVEDIH